MKRTFLLPLILLAMQSCAQKTELNLIVGTYTKPGESEGIYVYKFNTGTAEFEQKGLAKGVENPSYLTVSADKKIVYSVNETSKTSSVSAFAFDGVKGELKFLNKQPSGQDPCYVISDDQHVISANYSGGNVSVFGIQPDGSLSSLKQTVQHSGKSVNKDRQNSPHVHMVQFTPDHRFLVVNDLGTDKVYIYKYNANESADVLTPHDSVRVEAGSGPRHIVFSGDGKYAYLIDEMFAKITVFRYNDGSLKQLQETKITPDGFSGENGAADIHISPDGKFLYASNRGSENKITIFSIEKGGLLSKKGMVSTGGKGPRNFVIDPTGKYLLVGHQQTNNIVIFERNTSSGMLKDIGKRINVGSPVCLVFAQIK